MLDAHLYFPVTKLLKENLMEKVETVEYGEGLRLRGLLVAEFESTFASWPNFTSHTSQTSGPSPSNYWSHFLGPGRLQPNTDEQDCQSDRVFLLLRSSACRKVRSPRHSARNLSALGLDDLTSWHVESCGRRDISLL